MCLHPALLSCKPFRLNLSDKRAQSIIELIMFRIVLSLLLLFLCACGKDPATEPPPAALISGGFLAGGITCNGGDAGAAIRSLFEAPNSLRLQVSGASGGSTATALQIRGRPGCTITSSSFIQYMEPGNRTKYRALVTPGGVYSCTPAACDALCGTVVAPGQIDYDLIFDGHSLDLYSESTDPLCARILLTYALIP